MSIFEAVKSYVNVFDVANKYSPNKTDRANKMRCPFHSENTASLSIKANGTMYHCFGCHAGGDCVNFVSRLFNITPIEAARQINEDFHLNINISSNNDIEVKKRIETARKKRELTESFNTWLNDTYSKAAESLRQCNEMLQAAEPFSDRYTNLIRIRESNLFILDAILNNHIEYITKLYEQRG